MLNKPLDNPSQLWSQGTLRNEWQLLFIIDIIITLITITIIVRPIIIIIIMKSTMPLVRG